MPRRDIHSARSKRVFNPLWYIPLLWLNAGILWVFFWIMGGPLGFHTWKLIVPVTLLFTVTTLLSFLVGGLRGKDPDKS